MKNFCVPLAGYDSRDIDGTEHLLQFVSASSLGDLRVWVAENKIPVKSMDSIHEVDVDGDELDSIHDGLIDIHEWRRESLEVTSRPKKTYIAVSYYVSAVCDAMDVGFYDEEGNRISGSDWTRLSVEERTRYSPCLDDVTDSASIREYIHEFCDVDTETGDD